MLSGVLFRAECAIPVPVQRDDLLDRAPTSQPVAPDRPAQRHHGARSTFFDENLKAAVQLSPKKIAEVDSIGNYETAVH
jgi:hypothetical protein